MTDQFSNIELLGDAQSFLESYNWTNDSLRDLESVNINGIHTISCGFQVHK